MLKIKTGSNQKQLVFILFLTLYFLINLTFLTGFPTMHSDEAWLSGLSRYIAVNSQFSATEPFFDLKPRNPHAIRALFHSIQSIIIKLFGYHLWQMRLISLVSAVVCLFYFYKLSYCLFKQQVPALLATLLLSLDLQFIYTAHFARPEIIILSGLIIGAYIFAKSYANHSFRHDLILGLFTGLNIGIHPNSLFIAITLTLFYLYRLLTDKKFKIANLALYLITVALFATFFIFLSITFDPHFIKNYSTYGHAQFKVLNSFSLKWMAYYKFYLELFRGDAGTYYAPEIRLQLILFPLIIFFTTINLLFHKEKGQLFSLPLLVIAAINCGIFLVGRFNQTSVIFQFPFFYILISAWISILPKLPRKITTVCFILALTAISFWSIKNSCTFSYSTYLAKLSRYVPKNQNTLASLNTEYYFDLGKIYDYRNLPYLEKHNIDFGEYIRRNKIRYIIYPQSMDWIYRNRPRYNYVYGNSNGYFPEMKQFLKDHCKLVGSFSSRGFGVEIPRYSKVRNWQVFIYQVLEDN